MKEKDIYDYTGDPEHARRMDELAMREAAIRSSRLASLDDISKANEKYGKNSTGHGVQKNEK